MKPKSYKREVAATSLLFFAGLLVALFCMSDVNKINALAPIITGLGSTVVVMAFGVFGLHAWINKGQS